MTYPLEGKGADYPPVSEVFVERAQLGIDGNCGFALLGKNIQEGEAEFVEITDIPLNHPDDNIFRSYSDRLLSAKLLAARKAFDALRERLNMPELSFYFGQSHPYGK